METATTAAILQALPDPVLLIDSQKTIVTANEAAKNLMGVEIEGRSLALALRQPEVLDAVNDVLRGEDQQSARISLFMSVRRIFDIQVAALEAATQSDARAVLIMHDMTAAQNAEQMRADFVANVSHELRSPTKPAGQGLKLANGQEVLVVKRNERNLGRAGRSRE